MRNQQVTSSASRDFEFSSELQCTASPHETQGPREVGHKGECSPLKHCTHQTFKTISAFLLLPTDNRSLQEEVRTYKLLKEITFETEKIYFVFVSFLLFTF